MIHYTCDCCGRSIDSQEEVRYVLRLEVYAALDPLEEESDDERDHLQEIQDVLESLDELGDDELSNDVYSQQRYDLCAECRKQFVKNPLARMTMHEMGFSKN